LVPRLAFLQPDGPVAGPQRLEHGRHRWLRRWLERLRSLDRTAVAKSPASAQVAGSAEGRSEPSRYSLLLLRPGPVQPRLVESQCQLSLWHSEPRPLPMTPGYLCPPM